MRFNRTFILDLLKSKAFSVFVILLFHVSGVIGLFTESRQWFLDLTPLNLIISLVMVLRHDDLKNYKLILYLALIYFLGYFVEVLGVNTGLIFGHYLYGPVLGVKLLNTPLLIGVNWLIMIYCTRMILERFPLHTILKSLIGALLMTLIDYIIEPVAVYLNFWTWEGGVIPIQNYIAWFVFSFLFLMIFSKAPKKGYNASAPWLLVIQIIFFLVLNFLI